MPLTKKGKKIKRAMQEHYGPEKGEQVFHASANKGTIEGVEQRRPRPRGKRGRERRATQEVPTTMRRRKF
jgi:hypothetical protein